MGRIEALYGLPKNVIFCKSCVISNQRPSSTVEFKSKIKDKKEVINFSNDGICSACTFQKEKNNNIDWSQREKSLQQLCDKYRKKDGSYDVLIPGSGGKDSGLQAHLLKNKYGMNPLTVTWSPHLYTDIGLQNFNNWIHIGGFDNFLYTPNGRLHRLLTKLAFKNLLHPFQPFIIGQKQIGPLMASKFGIKFIMYGETGTEAGNKKDEAKRGTMHQKYYSQDLNKLDLNLGGVKIRDIINDYGFKLGDFKSYIPMPPSGYNNIDVHYLSYYLKWDPQEAYYYASENTGFSGNSERTSGTYSKYSSIDDKIDYFHWYTTLIKFGIGRASYDAAQEIRTGKITREEGQLLVKRYDEEFPQKYLEDFLEYISISEDEFYQTIDSFRSPHIWGKDTLGNWKLNHNVNKTGLKD
tara:strand:+ start:3708 stop:4934 length:1227 start_codon:yes stop_codon:yes gene_type:complete